MNVLEFIGVDKACPYRIWFDSLDCSVASKISTAKRRLELGHTSSIKWIGCIGEYIIDSGPGYRIYLAKDGDNIIILYGGGTKSGQQQDINKAKIRHAEYKVSKKSDYKAVKVPSKDAAKNSNIRKSNGFNS